MDEIEIKTDTKHLLGDIMLGKKLHCICNCLIHLDFIGTVVDYSIENNLETMLHIKIKDTEKIIKIGLFHPGMTIDILK